MKHKHADLIYAWADGAEIQVKINGNWEDRRNQNWFENIEYRIKPAPPAIFLCANTSTLTWANLSHYAVILPMAQDY